MKDISISDYKTFLMLDEKSDNTIKKYIRDTERFLKSLKGKKFTKQEVINYKNSLLNSYEVTSVNSYLAAINKYLDFIKKPELKVKYLRIQQTSYSDENNILTINDYYALCNATKENSREHLILNTICSTGIRVSELEFFTVEAIKKGHVEIMNKGKIRRIIIPEKLKIKLLKYAATKHIVLGPIFITRYGNPIDRGYIWKMLKKLAIKAQIDTKKVYPHNLRKLFARQFYEKKKDVVKLADVLGHSNMNTTRIYLKQTEKGHKKIIDILNLVY